MEFELCALKAKLRALPCDGDQPYDYNRLALNTINSPGSNAIELQ